MGMIIMNGKEYTSSPKDGFPPIIYSDEEREIGVWRDGRPLYQKSYHFQGVLNQDVLIDSTITQIDNELVDVFGSWAIGTYHYTDSRQASIFETIKFLGNTTPHPIVFVNSSGLYYNSNQNNYGFYMYLTIQYTKTTDVPGSGKYTTYGGLAHHYSTTEQVVGTWIDGKPLYEVTVRNINLTHNSWTTVFNGSSIGASVKRCWGGIGIGGDTTRAYCDLNYYRSNDEFACCSMGASVSVLANVYSPEYLIYCVIQYTKTTD